HDGASMKAPLTCWADQVRQTSTSAWNCSKGLPVPGRTWTLGPRGAVAQPVYSIMVASATAVMPVRACIATSRDGQIQGFTQSDEGRPGPIRASFGEETSGS